MRLDSLQDVLADQIGDLRSAEEQLIEALPKVVAAAHYAHFWPGSEAKKVEKRLKCMAGSKKERGRPRPL